MTIIQRADLACREGSKDAVYHIQIAQREGGFTVDYQNGRRGSTLTNATKTKAPVSMEAAQKIFDKTVREKMTAAPPYKPIAGQGDALTNSQAMTQIAAEMSQRSTGLAFQLLNSISATDSLRYIDSDEYVAQQKFNGERRGLRSARGSDPIGANRRGLEVPLESDLVLAVEGMVCTLDGELVGSRLYAFDLLELNGVDMRSLPYSERLRELGNIESRMGSGVVVVQTARSPEQKRALVDIAVRKNQEGVVFKRLDATYEAGRPSDGGPQLKYKFTEDVTVVVMRQKEDRRSVEIGAYDVNRPDAGLIPLGAVTIPPNQNIPAVNSLIDVNYLYAYEGGSLFQPVFLRPRNDIEMKDVNISRLKYISPHEELSVEPVQARERQRG